MLNSVNFSNNDIFSNYYYDVNLLDDYYSKINKFLKHSAKVANLEENNLLKVQEVSVLESEHVDLIDTLFKQIGLQVYPNNYQESLSLKEIRKKEYEKTKTIIRDIFSGKSNIQLEKSSSIEFRRAVLLDILILSSVPTGRKLFVKLTKQKDNILIRESKCGKNQAQAIDQQVELCQEAWEVIPISTDTSFGFLAPLPRFIALAHELIHVWHALLLGREAFEQLGQVQCSQFDNLVERYAIIGSCKGKAKDLKIYEQILCKELNLPIRDNHKAGASLDGGLLGRPEMCWFAICWNAKLEVISYFDNGGTVDEIINRGLIFEKGQTISKEQLTISSELCVIVANELFKGALMMQGYKDNIVTQDFTENAKKIINGFIGEREAGDPSAELFCSAASLNAIEVMKYLLANGVSINVKNEEGKTALIKAVKNNQIKAIEFLREKGCEIDFFSQQQLLRTAIIHNANETFEYFLEDETLKDVQDEKGNTLLHLAVEESKIYIVNLLLKKKCSFTISNNKNRLPLHIAVKNWLFSPLIVHSLIMASSPQDLQNFRMDSRGTILHLAISNQDEKAVEMLLDKRCCLDVPNNNQQLPIHLAVEKEACNIVKMLLAKDSPIDERDNQGNTALHLAIRNGEIEIIEALLNSGCRIDLPNNLGEFAVDIAQSMGDEEIIDLLSKKRADISFTATFLNSFTALIASIRGYFDQKIDE